MTKCRKSWNNSWTILIISKKNPKIKLLFQIQKN